MIKTSKYRGTIAVNDFEVLKIRHDDDKGMTYQLLKVNIDDADIHGLAGSLSAIVEAFKPTFE